MHKESKMAIVPDVNNGVHSWVVSSRSDLFTNIAKERFDRIGTALHVLNPVDGDLVIEHDTDHRYYGTLFSGDSWKTWIPAEHGIFRILWTRTSSGLICMTNRNEPVVSFATEDWPLVCDVLAGKLSATEFRQFKFLAEVGILRKQVEELGKLARSYDAERRRFAEAIATAARGLHDTRRFVKSLRIQKIREALEVALRG